MPISRGTRRPKTAASPCADRCSSDLLLSRERLESIQPFFLRLQLLSQRVVLTLQLLDGLEHVKRKLAVFDRLESLRVGDDELGEHRFDILRNEAERSRGAKMPVGEFVCPPVEAHRLQLTEFVGRL